MLIHGCHVSVSLSLSHFFVSEYALMAVGIREQPEWEKTRTDERKKITRHKILDTRGATYARGINWIQLSQLIRILSHTLTTELLLTYSAGLLSYPACTLVYAASPFVPPHPPSNLLRHPSFFFFCFILLSLVNRNCPLAFPFVLKGRLVLFLCIKCHHTYSPQFAHQSCTCPKNQNP